jgi:hypothetical protein
MMSSGGSEREGTACDNLPETHALLKWLRHDLDERYGTGSRVLLAEANQPPELLREYFGNGDECHMASTGRGTDVPATHSRTLRHDDSDRSRARTRRMGLVERAVAAGFTWCVWKRASTSSQLV